MHQLLLLRHAKAAPAAAGQDDRERPLNRQGQAAVSAMRDAIMGLGLMPDLVLVSPSRRTVETLEALEPWPETPLLEQIEELYLAEPAAILSVLQGVAETVRSVLLIGHNPGLHQFARTLHDGGAAPQAALRRLDEGFPTAALAEFAVPGAWSQLDARRGRLVRFVVPRDLTGPAA